MSLDLIFATLVYVTILAAIFGFTAFLADWRSTRRRRDYDDEDDYYG